jgi:hypothetical protein
MNFMTNSKTVEEALTDAHNELEQSFADLK